MDENNNSTASEPTSAPVGPEVEQPVPTASTESVVTQAAPAPETPVPAPVQPEVQEPTVSEPTPATPPAEPEIEQQPAPVMTQDQPAATETTAAPKKNSSWKIITLIVLLVALVGVAIYYWSIGAF